MKELTIIICYPNVPSADDVMRFPLEQRANISVSSHFATLPTYVINNLMTYGWSGFTEMLYPALTSEQMLNTIILSLNEWAMSDLPKQLLFIQPEQLASVRSLLENDTRDRAFNYLICDADEQTIVPCFGRKIFMAKVKDCDEYFIRISEHNLAQTVA
ncbi:MAG: hypothetical protein ABIO57_03750 [Candidatus Paceibacterota bacterium]